jgi:hypothetical protein
MHPLGKWVNPIMLRKLVVKLRNEFLRFNPVRHFWLAFVY